MRATVAVVKANLTAAIGTASLLLLSSSTVLADQPPTITTDTIVCQPLDYGDAVAHDTAVLACEDPQDGINFSVHQLGNDWWLSVEPIDS